MPSAGESRSIVLDSQLPDTEEMLQIKQTLPFANSIKDIDVLVSNSCKRRRTKGFIFHSCNTHLPERSFWKIHSQLYVVSPELSYVQMGRELSDVQLAEYATNLCGSFFLRYEDRAICAKQAKTTSLQKLKRYLLSCESVYGTRNASRCLSWVAEGSASPMETKLFLRLCLPVSKGGYGLPMPVLNKVIKPGKKKNLTEQDYFVADLCWPEQGVIVEYDGEQYHHNVSHDRRRINALETIGWKVFCLTKQEMYDAFAFDMLARQIAKSLGRRVRVSAAWVEKVSEVQKQLHLATATTPLWAEAMGTISKSV